MRMLEALNNISRWAILLIAFGFYIYGHKEEATFWMVVVTAMWASDRR